MERAKAVNKLEKARVEGVDPTTIDTDLEEVIATERYEFIERVEKETVIKKKMPESVSDKLDKVFLNKWLAFPIFIIIMFIIVIKMVLLEMFHQLICTEL